MEQFIVGRKYGNGQNFYTVVGILENVGQGRKAVNIQKKGESEPNWYPLDVIDDVETCQPKDKKTPLKASSLMGKVSHKKILTEEEREERRKKARLRWNKQNYDELHIFLPNGTKARMEEARLKQGYKSMRAWIINALESAIKISY